MNTSTRNLATDEISHHRSRVIQKTKSSLAVTALLIMLVISAFSLIYVKDLNRRMFIELQLLQREKTHELIEWGKLLLERGTWSTQSRIQQIARSQLGMRTPNSHHIFLVERNKSNIKVR